MEAPNWSVEIQYEENPQCLLSEYLKLFHSICDQELTIRQLLGEDMFQNEENKIPDVFDRLTGTGSNYSLSSMIGKGLANRLGRSASLGTYMHKK